MSPIRAAVLGSECGTGKTNVALMAIWIMVQKIKSGNFSYGPGKPKYLPSIMFMPPSAIRQFVRSVKRFWPKVFRVYCLYSHWKYADIILADVVCNIDEFKAAMSRCMSNPEDESTGLTLFITTYQTGMRRLFRGVDDPKRLDDEELELRKQVELGYARANSRAARAARASTTPRFASEDIAELDPEERESYEEADEAAYSEADVLIEEDDDSLDVNGGPEAVQRARTGAAKAFEHSRELVFEGEFAIVICDECHVVKDPASVSNHMVAMLKKVSWLGISATPAANTGHDYLGYLLLVWKTGFPFGFGHNETELATPFFDSHVIESIERKEGP